MLSYTLYKYTEVGEQNCIIALYFFLKETSVFLLYNGWNNSQIYTFINNARGLHFLHILINSCYFCLFDNKHSDRCEVIYFFMVLIWIFLIISDANIISFICWSSVHFFFLNSIDIFCTFFKYFCRCC